MSDDCNLITGCLFDKVGMHICKIKLKLAVGQTNIWYGWNAHFQDDILTVMDDEVKSILRRRLTCGI